MRISFSKLPLVKFLARMVQDRRGVSAVVFAISFAVLTPMAMGVFDIYQSNEQRGKLQDALDAAALYAARSTATDTPGVNTIGNKALNANLQLIHGATLNSSTFTLVSAQGDTKVVAQASVTLAAYAPMEFTHTPVTVSSEVTRPGNNLEVALVLDTTGSMGGTRIANLQSAANQLIDLVVSPNQTPYYSKIAIVPYSNSVNPGTYTNAVRGIPATAPSPIAAPCVDAAGCTQIKFTAASGSGHPTYDASNCVSERTGSEAFTDASYSVAKVGYVYPPTTENLCIGATIQPLTSDKTLLHNEIGSLTALNSTAGHIGLAWGWYTISPNWATLFPTASKPAAYGTPHLLKVVVLMTDGAFNTAYCNGVIAKDSGSGSGTVSKHISCNATNGDSFTQAQKLCANMKALPNPVIIYTVGFDVSSDPSAQSLLANCATDSSHVYFPADDGVSLQVAFQQIAADLNRLRLSH
ncbi:MAG: pilus assembly protein TadG-related protein [Caulobacterales bacterium]|jgi:Flp pilus assembly protein TadG